MWVDIGLKFYAVPSWYDLEVKVTDLEILCLSFGETFCKSICLEHRVRKTRVLNHKTQPSGFLRVNPYTLGSG